MNPFKLSGFFALLFLASCSDSASPDLEKQVFCEGDGIVVSDAWIRKPRAGQRMGAAYLSICNGSNALDRLVSVEFTSAAAVELHVTEMDENSVAAMRSAGDGIALPALSETALAPGGSHIMLINPNAELAEADGAVMTLNFANAPPATVVFEIRQEIPSAHDRH